MRLWELFANVACALAVVLFALALLAGWLDWWPA
jgi:hypothetical protein